MKSDSLRYEQALALASNLEAKAADPNTSVQELMMLIGPLVHSIADGTVRDDDEIWTSGKILNAIVVALERIKVVAPEAETLLRRLQMDVRLVEDPSDE